jgi:AcrR family transcriptional regulator
MITRTQILSRAEAVFDERGFAASGMDRLTDAAGVSTRTLYKHVGSKTALIEAVLRERSGRFFAQVTATSVAELFAGLEQWASDEGARGCFFLRAAGENGDGVTGVSEAVAEYRARLGDLIAVIVAEEAGESDELLAEQILVLFEGATSAASYRGVPAVRAAAAAASALVAARRSARS